MRTDKYSPAQLRFCASHRALLASAHLLVPLTSCIPVLFAHICGFFPKEKSFSFTHFSCNGKSLVAVASDANDISPQCISCKKRLITQNKTDSSPQRTRGNRCLSFKKAQLFVEFIAVHFKGQLRSFAIHIEKTLRHKERLYTFLQLHYLFAYVRSLRNAETTLMGFF